MVQLKCRNLNGNECDFVARGKTIWEVMLKMFDHYAKDHKEMLWNMTKDEQRELIEKMESLISDKPYD